MGKELSNNDLANFIDIWKMGCQSDTKEEYKDCRECPSKKNCKQAYQQIEKLIEDSENWEEIKIAEYERGLKDAKPRVSISKIDFYRLCLPTLHKKEKLLLLKKYGIEVGEWKSGVPKIVHHQV